MECRKRLFLHALDERILICRAAATAAERTDVGVGVLKRFVGSKRVRFCRPHGLFELKRLEILLLSLHHVSLYRNSASALHRCPSLKLS